MPPRPICTAMAWPAITAPGPPGCTGGWARPSAWRRCAPLPLPPFQTLAAGLRWAGGPPCPRHAAAGGPRRAETAGARRSGHGAGAAGGRAIALAGAGAGVFRTAERHRGAADQRVCGSRDLGPGLRAGRVHGAGAVSASAGRGAAGRGIVAAEDRACARGGAGVLRRRAGGRGAGRHGRCGGGGGDFRRARAGGLVGGDLPAVRRCSGWMFFRPATWRCRPPPRI